MIDSPRIVVRKSRQGRCFELAGKGQDRAPEWLLVHGTVSGVKNTDHAKRIAHAWLEHDGKVYDPVQDKTTPRTAYYAEWRAVAERTYTRIEAAHASLNDARERANGRVTSGPWHETEGAMGDNE